MWDQRRGHGEGIEEGEFSEAREDLAVLVHLVEVSACLVVLQPQVPSVNLLLKFMYPATDLVIFIHFLYY